MVDLDAVRGCTGIMSVWSVVSLLIFITATSGNDGDALTKTTTAQPVALPKRPLSDTLPYRTEDYKEVFMSLDLNNDEEISIDELKTFYHPKEAEFAIQKFMKLVDTAKNPGKIDLEEMTNFMNKEEVKKQIHEVIFFPTEEVRKRFFADKILSYVYLVIEEKAINSLFDSIDANNDGNLDLKEIQEMQVKLMNGDHQFELPDWKAKLVIAEVGLGSMEISKEAFKKYLQDGDLSYFFRECRKKVTETDAEYDNACLVQNLVHFSTTQLTEYMMTLILNELDGVRNNEKVDPLNVLQSYGCSEVKAKNFITIILGEDKEFTYQELRGALRVPTLKEFLEKSCLVSGKETLGKRADCLKWKLWYYIRKNSTPKYIYVPDLDVIYLFEDLDTSDDGKIDKDEDLEKGKGWDNGLAKKFMDEVAPAENKAKVNLRDFYNFVQQPYMTCAVGECQIIKNNDQKYECYHHEVKDMITISLDKKEVDEFFLYYKHNIIYYVTLDHLNINQHAIETFLDEEGQGDHFVSPSEFSLFVKQQQLGHLFVTDETVTPKAHHPPSELHEKLLHYHEHSMSEYDIVLLFGLLDDNNDKVIDQQDIDNVYELDEDVVSRMAVYGNKEHFTFHEFWIFLNSKAPGSQETRRYQLENTCGQINQEQEMKCYKTNIKTLE